MPRLTNHRHERFCQLFVNGNPHHEPGDDDSPPETIHRANQSYLQAGYSAGRASARVLGSRLLSRPEIQARIGELRSEAEALAGLRVRRWRQLLPAAQETLIRALEGQDVTLSSLRAAKIVIEQAEGSVAPRPQGPADDPLKAPRIWIYGRDPNPPSWPTNP